MMKIDKVHPQLRKAISRIPPLPFHSRLFLTIFNLLLKIAPTPKPNAGLNIAGKKLANASMRIYRPEGELSGACLLWIHGGGLICGTASQDERMCSAWALDLNMVVISVDYRLAPKHPFPAAIDDCFETWLWLQEDCQNLGIDPTRIVISGQSAGAGLAACLGQRLQDQGGNQPIGQALFCPMLDDRTAANHDLDAVDHRVWNNKSNRAGWSWYLGASPGGKDVPQYASAARRVDVGGLPETWIGIGDIDLFYDESCHYASRLREAGVGCELEIVAMAPHAFENAVPDAPVTLKYLASYSEFLRRVLGL